MAYVTLPSGGLWFCSPNLGGESTLSTTLVIDASAEKIAFVFRAPKTGTLDQFEFQPGTVTNSGTPSVVRVSFQDVDATTGDPDGTQDQFRDVSVASLSSNTWAIPGLITSDGTDTGVKRSVAAGDILCAVIEYSTFNAGAVVNMTTHAWQATVMADGFPYTDVFTASWGKQTSTGRAPMLALKYSDGSYGMISDFTVPISSYATETFNVTSTGDERGLIFQLPVPVKTDGCWLRCDTDADANVILYSGTTAMVTVLLDKDIRSQSSLNYYEVPFGSEQTLTANTNYRLIYQASTVGNVGLFVATVNAQALLDAWPGGQNAHYTSRTDAGAFAQTTTKRPLMGIHVSSLDDGTGGAGGGVPAGATQGLVVT